MIRLSVLRNSGHISPTEALCSSAVKASIDANCKIIVCLTETGGTAMQLSKYRPEASILAVTASEQTQRQLLIVGTDSVISKALDKAKADGMVVKGDQVVAVHGQREECPGHSNILKMVAVP